MQISFVSTLYATREGGPSSQAKRDRVQRREERTEVAVCALSVDDSLADPELTRCDEEDRPKARIRRRMRMIGSTRDDEMRSVWRISRDMGRRGR